MARLFIRNRTAGFVTFIKGKQELKSFIDDYLPGRHLIVGDIAMFTGGMIQMLLKFIEENPAVDCYSTADLSNPILQSRFVEIIKDPIQLPYEPGDDKFIASDKSYQSAQIHLAESSEVKLRAPLLRGKALNLLLNGTSN